MHMWYRRSRWVVVSFFVVACSAIAAPAVELARLTDENWKTFTVSGKEADRILGDWVLRNEEIAAVIAAPLSTRNANMTVRNVGWGIIDLTLRREPNDQLSAFYPESLRYPFASPEKIRIDVDGQAVDPQSPGPWEGRVITIACQADTPAGKPTVEVRYTLRGDDPYVTVETVYQNRGKSEIEIESSDTVRADRTFAFGTGFDGHVFWADDEWFRQTYVIVAEAYQLERSGNRGVVVQYHPSEGTKFRIPAEGSLRIARRLLPAANLAQGKGLASRLLGQNVHPVSLTVRDPRGRVRHARIEVRKEGRAESAGRTGPEGRLQCDLAPGKYEIVVQALGRPEVKTSLDVEGPVQREIMMESCGYVVAKIVDTEGNRIPCKVAFEGIEGTPNPYFGPDSAVTVENLKYSHNGRFRQEIGPGRYRVRISYGPEYDAVTRDIEVRAGEETPLEATLVRSVVTTGWISADFHSHSTPSGDNTCSQRARVLNLLCEHIEFAPCTEHNRIDSYIPHLEALGVRHRMATCSGIELTGQPLPINHQNAFPLKLVPRTQDNGAPLTDENPIAQIERLAMWNNNSEKLVQGNHPNLVQMLGDRDLDGKPDGGFAPMLQFMDVIEVHPLQPILLVPGTEAFAAEKRNPIFHWMQMLNLGFRIPGVVNTDAHYSFHESGFLRNYIRCSTDDPQEISTMEIVRRATAGEVVMTNGPFLEFTVKPRGATQAAYSGQDLAAPEGNVELWIKVQCPNWLDVNRIQVFVNGRPEPKLNFTRREHTDRFANGSVKFEQRIPWKLATDAHVLVAAAGEGLTVGPVMGPRWGAMMPIAVSNPVFVDVNGDGFHANGDLLGVPLPLEKTANLPQR